MSETALDKKKLEYLQALEDRAALQRDLPHLYGWKWYKWAREFFESTNHYNFCCSANQISKSSTQIRKCIRWATDIALWPSLWPTKPKQFWYMYPDYGVATVEFEEKWVKEFLPRGKMKDHPIFGWKAEYGTDKKIRAIKFNSGVTVYFKVYEQKARSLQTSSVYAVFADEELPVELFDEVNIRMSAPSVNGYFHMVFTATLGQQLWFDTIEKRGKPDEKFKDAFKVQVSMYDCLVYEDGTASLWTRERIAKIIDSCKNENEVQRRVFGRFVVSDNLKYPAFSEAVNVVADHHLPKSWAVYAGVDPGSGGKNHPAAIVFLAVNPEMTQGRVFKCWRGDGIMTTSSDLVQKYVNLRGQMHPVVQAYDWAARDFMLIAGRCGMAFVPANKEVDYGTRLLNTLFKTGMLKIHDHFEGQKLVWELKTHREEKHHKVGDDLIDALRYAATAVPWNFEAIAGTLEHFKPKDPEDDKNLSKREKEYREAARQDKEVLDLFEAEFDEANELIDYYQEA